MTVEGLHDGWHSSDPPAFVLSAMLQSTTHNMHTLSPLVSASVAEENRSLVLVDCLMDAHSSHLAELL